MRKKCITQRKRASENSLQSICLETERGVRANHGDRSSTTDHPAIESVTFESFLDTGIITKIDVYAKNELRVLFQDGKVKTMDCPGKS